MTRLAVITPSFAPDFELCADLHRSVLDYSPDSVHHHIIVPRQDLKLFGRLAGSRTHIHCEADLLPRSFVSIPFSKFTVNLVRPFPPVRGWILQQVLKLAAVAASEDDVVLLVDSDIEFLRPFTVKTFFRDGVVRFYGKPRGIDERLPRHMIWHRVARALLGLPAAELPYTDYISSLLAWDPAIVRRCSRGSRPRRAARGPRRSPDKSISLNGRCTVCSSTTCLGRPPTRLPPTTHCAWRTGARPRWTKTAQGKFLCDLQPTDIAAMISAKSRTPLASNARLLPITEPPGPRAPWPQCPAGDHTPRALGRNYSK